MTTPSIGTKGANLDIVIRQGATFGPYVTTIKGTDGLPINVTGYTFRGQVRKTADAATAAASLTFTLTDPTNGVVTFVISATATAAITCDPDSELDAASQYVWDCEMEDGSGVVTALLYGTAAVFREVTK